MNCTEKFVKEFYESINVLGPDQLTISGISKRLKIKVFYWDYTSEIIRYKRKYKMFLNGNLTRQGQWTDFGHELGHYFYDSEDQSCLPQQYVFYQECKADYFSYHFCVPTFMLMEIKGVDVYDVMHLFNVDFDFAYRRLEMYKNTLMSRRACVAL